MKNKTEQLRKVRAKTSKAIKDVAQITTALESLGIAPNDILDASDRLYSVLRSIEEAMSKGGQ